MVLGVCVLPAPTPVLVAIPSVLLLQSPAAAVFLSIAPHPVQALADSKQGLGATADAVDATGVGFCIKLVVLSVPRWEVCVKRSLRVRRRCRVSLSQPPRSCFRGLFRAHPQVRTEERYTVILSPSIVSSLSNALPGVARLTLTARIADPRGFAHMLFSKSHLGFTTVCGDEFHSLDYQIPQSLIHLLRCIQHLSSVGH